MKTIFVLGLAVLIGSRCVTQAEQPPAQLPAGHPPIGGDMRGQSLPGDVMAQASNPQWTAPANWKSVPASSMRRATFQIRNADGQSAEVAVSAFPGDVGGSLANVNRWRGQIGLGPVTQVEVDAMTKQLEVPAGKATEVEFAKEKVRMVVITLPHAGNSWFFKLTGDTAVVEAEKSKLVDFVKSVKFQP